MKSITDQLSEILGNAFTKAGYEAKLLFLAARIYVSSNVMELCQMQNCSKNRQWLLPMRLFHF